MQVENAASAIFLAVFREMRPRTPPPEIRVEFRPFANANSTVRLERGKLTARITDVLAGAPSPILDALARILLGKLFRREVPAVFEDRYRRYLNRREMRRSLHLLRSIRGRKPADAPRGRCFDLVEIFEELNRRYFHGLMARPVLAWSRAAARATFGHYDPSHNAIVISRYLDRPEAPRLAVEYVMFHEMLHLRFPVDHTGARRCVHTREFRDAEKQFERLAEAERLMKRI